MYPIAQDKKRNLALSYIVACLNALLWTAFVIIAFVQVKKHSDYGDRTHTITQLIKMPGMWPRSIMGLSYLAVR